MERANVLAKLLEKNFGGVNKALAETRTGVVDQIKNALGDLREQFGKKPSRRG